MLHCHIPLADIADVCLCYGAVHRSHFLRLPEPSVSYDWTANESAAHIRRATGMVLVESPSLLGYFLVKDEECKIVQFNCFT